MLRQISADAVEVLGGMIRATPQEGVHHFMAPDARIVLEAVHDNYLIKTTEPDTECFPAIGREARGGGEMDSIEVAPEPTALLQRGPDRTQGIAVRKGLGFTKPNNVVTGSEQETKEYQSAFHMFNLRPIALQETGI